MEQGDDISTLSFFEDDLKEMCVVAKSAKKRIPCRVPSCPKMFSHSSSMYRHVSHVHGSVFTRKENGSEFSTTQPAKSDVRSQETTVDTRRDPGSSTRNHDPNLDIEIERHNGKSVEEELQDLQQQMITSCNDTLFVHFQTVLETIPQADPQTIEHLKSFHQVLTKALIASPDNTTDTTQSLQAPPQSKRSLPVDPPQYLNNIFAPSADVFLYHTEVEYSDEGERSPFKRAYYAEIDFSRSYSDDMVTHSWVGEHHNAVTPRVLTALPCNKPSVPTEEEHWPSVC